MSAHPREYPPALPADDHDDDVLRDWYQFEGTRGFVVRWFIKGDSVPHRTRAEALQALAARSDRRQGGAS